MDSGRCTGKIARSKFTSRTAVRVVANVRSFTESERQFSTYPSQISLSASKGDHASIILHDRANGRRNTYTLDSCYEQVENVTELFIQEVKPLLQGILDGKNSCVIAFGARRSGKTQLIEGSEEIPGLAMKSFCELIPMVEEIGGSIAISCYRIYHDHVYDLLEHKEKEVQILEDVNKRIQLKGLSKIPVKTLSDFQRYYLHISNLPNISHKVANDISIRSHKGLIIHVTFVDKDLKNSFVGKINFVDLAGYVDVRQSTNTKADLSEFTENNKSLNSLLNVVSALNGDEPYIPFRGTKLTHLLKDFLCRMSNAVLITCLNSSLCPSSVRTIKLASSVCQLNLPRIDSTRNNKENRKRGPLMDNHVLGSGKKQISDSVSTPRRLQSSRSMVKKPTSSYQSTRKKLFSDASLLANARQSEKPCLQEDDERSKALVTLALEEESAGSNALSIFIVLKEECSPLPQVAESSSITKEDSLIAMDYDSQSSAWQPAHSIDLDLSCDAEGNALSNGKNDSCGDLGKHSPTLTQQLREISNTLKTLSYHPVSLCTSVEDGSCSKQLAKDCAEPKTPGFADPSKPSFLEPMNFAMPQDKFRTRSRGLKKSLVNECLDFLNSASKEELKQLKGIGEKRANYILELREEMPEPFKEIDDLKELGLSSKQIKGMMAKILADI
ncbi:hypothetical protein HPP92_025473 [Vanilla planifolia]|uniref:Kinesin motor domain-containing protein n=1 Tax=Vanilla planifolia TaxID=51239 RepID=A0A835PM13_VANPL|nr:hypothetical protein HPP92_025473 [Vanilla planifolia]